MSQEYCYVHKQFVAHPSGVYVCIYTHTHMYIHVYIYLRVTPIILLVAVVLFASYPHICIVRVKEYECFLIAG